MPNMSYCRFRNTELDLAECEEALDEVITGNLTLSDDELAAAKRLVKRSQSIVRSLGSLIDWEDEEGDGPLNHDFDTDLERLNDQ